VLTNLNDGYARSDAFGINDHDQIVGDVHVYQANGVIAPYAAVWDHSTTPTFLPTVAGFDFIYGYGINNHGWVVGQACLHTDYLDCIAVISDGASTIDLNEHLDPADRSTWFLAKAVGINDAGQIIGTGSFYGNPHAFLATPIKN
jgi:hypothetical protein